MAGSKTAYEQYVAEVFGSGSSKTSARKNSKSGSTNGSSTSRTVPGRQGSSGSLGSLTSSMADSSSKSSSHRGSSKSTSYRASVSDVKTPLLKRSKTVSGGVGGSGTGMDNAVKRTKNLFSSGRERLVDGDEKKRTLGSKIGGWINTGKQMYNTGKQTLNDIRKVGAEITKPFAESEKKRRDEAAKGPMQKIDDLFNDKKGVPTKSSKSTTGSKRSRSSTDSKSSKSSKSSKRSKSGKSMKKFGAGSKAGLGYAAAITGAYLNEKLREK
jgi:hypothetical protein